MKQRYINLHAGADLRSTDQVWIDGSWRNCVDDRGFRVCHFHTVPPPSMMKSPLIFRRPIVAGDGYRLLAPGEIVQKGDEFFSPGSKREWRCTGVPGKRVGERATYRRAVPADVGSGYRLLTRGERVQAGDQWRKKAGEWMMATCLGFTVPPGDEMQYRRRVDPPPAPAKPAPAPPALAGRPLAAFTTHELFVELADRGFTPAFLKECLTPETEPEYRQRRSGGSAV